MAGAKYILVILAIVLAASVVGHAKVYDEGAGVQMEREREIIIIEPDEETEYC